MRLRSALWAGVVLAACVTAVVRAERPAFAVTEPAPYADLSSCVNGQAAGACSGDYNAYTNGVVSTTVTWHFYRSAQEVWVQFSSAAGSSTSTGPMCVKNHDTDANHILAATYNTNPNASSALVQVSAGNNTYADDQIMWGTAYSYRLPSGGVCTNSSIDPYVLQHVVPGPGIDCSREFVYNANGVSGVIVRAHVTNPNAGATDEVVIRFPWETADRAATQAYADLPASGMPATGWRGVCRVKRALLNGYSGDPSWRNGGAVQTNDVAPTELGNYYKISASSAATAYGSGGNPTTQLYVIEGGAAAAGAATCTGAVFACAAGVPIAAAVGWLLGGAIVGVANWHGDDEWYCRWNPGYRAVKSSYCAALMAEDYQRSESQFRDAAGNPLGLTSNGVWTTAYAVAEVLIDASRPDIGARTTTVSQSPITTPEQTTAIQGAEAPQAGNDRAVRQQTDGLREDDPRTPGQNDSQVPVAASTTGSGGNCNQSIWASLNPLNIAETMGCVLMRLFRPTDTSKVANLFAQAQTKFPFSLATLVALPAQALAAARDAADGGGCFTVHMPDAAGGQTMTISCADGTTVLGGNAASELATTKTIFLLVFYVGVVLGLLVLFRGVVNK